MKTITRLFALSLASAPVLLTPVATAQAQTMLNGTYVNGDNSAKWVFGNRTGQFIQYKSINGNPGTIVIDFRYALENNGKMLNYTQTQIRLEDHPMARSQSLNKQYREQIELRPSAIVIGGKTYSKR
ncbi:hypothetical protein [Parasphingorhabdus sp.]|uniref:hypothetical protein n=1 Tax=Parasphingorhabdus sp. TaxID=2709688 RepID=UPI003A94A769